MKDLVIMERSGQESIIPVEEVKKFIAPTATESELWMFLGLARAYNLNPFKREIHFVKYGSGENAKAQVIIGYEVYLKRAMETRNLEWWNVTIEGESASDMVAKFRAKRKDWEEVFEWEVYRSEFDKNQSTWRTMPKFMLKKCAIAQGMRLLFPEELGGMPYSPEEISGRTSEQINNTSVVDAQFEDVVEPPRVEPDAEEKRKVLELVIKKIEGFKTLEALEKWEGKQRIDKSILKEFILEALEKKRAELGGNCGASDRELMMAEICDLMKAAGDYEGAIEGRMKSLEKSSAAELEKILQEERKRVPPQGADKDFFGGKQDEDRNPEHQPPKR